MTEKNLWDEAEPKGYRRNAKGNLIREGNISGAERDMDAVVERIHCFGSALSEQMYRFREHTMTDIVEYLERLVARYGGKPRRSGHKGNVSLVSFDGRRKVQLTVADRVEVGPEIAAAQSIIEDCIDEWGKNSSIKLRALVDSAFRPDAAGRLSVSQLVQLRRVQIDDVRWTKVQQAITDALRPAGKAEYVRLYDRSVPTDPWQQVPLHLATVRPPDGSLAAGTPAEQLSRRVASAVAEARHSGLRQGEIRALVGAACARPGAVKPAQADQSEQADA